MMGVIMYYVGYENKPVFLIIVAVRAFFGSAMGIVLVMFTADCAEYGHFKSGKRAQGIAFSIQTFTAKITGALTGSIGLLVLGLVGFKESNGGEYLVQSQYTIDWIWKMFSILPVISGTAAVLLLIFFYRLKSSDVEIMMKANYGEITREEALSKLSREYK
jgi:Na+/melibiose symporter-like transporter